MEIFLMIWHKSKEKSIILIKTNFKGNFMKEKNMDKENTFSQMEIFTKDHGKMIVQVD